MSMIGNVRRLPEDDLVRLLAEPELMEQYLYEDPLEGFGRAADMDVDKAWHGIHFLLTGTSWDGEPPLNFFVGGGTAIGDVDVGYGPARGLNVVEVARLAAALEPLPADQLGTGRPVALGSEVVGGCASRDVVLGRPWTRERGPAPGHQDAGHWRD